MLTCPDCGGPLYEAYKANRRISSPAMICPICQSLWFNGERADLPNRWDEKYPTVSDMAKKAAVDLLEEAKKDPDFCARKYFERLFKLAFAEGFTRSYSVLKQNLQEGRIRRVRELWEKVDKDAILGLSEKEVEEISRLISLGSQSLRKQQH